MRKNLLAIACIVGLCSSAMAAAKTTTLEVVGGDGKMTVDGKAYVAGTPVKSGAKIEVQGSLTIKIGGVTFKTDGATLQLAGSTVKILAGTAQVTNAAGATQTVAKGDKVAVQTRDSAPPSIPADNGIVVITDPIVPQTSPLQEAAQRPVVSPSAP